MELQISSGFGPAECEIAVGKLLRALSQEIPGILIVEKQLGRIPDSYRSVRITSHLNLSYLEGTVKWVAQSPLRPSCKRKNWFVDISVCTQATITPHTDHTGEIRYETFLCSGHGGQHRDKTRTGVRAVHLPTGLAVTATRSRSQHKNKMEATNQLIALLTLRDQQNQEDARALDRLEHSRIELGNPVRVYEGLDFRRMI